MRRDGSVWAYEAVDWGNSEDYEWRLLLDRDRWMAISIATRRYPELLELLPERDPNAPDCPYCGGEGRLPDNAVCPQCGSLGWIPLEAT